MQDLQTIFLMKYSVYVS